MQRRSAVTASSEAAPSDPNDSSFDPGILAFGSSASVNADLKRAIKKDIEEIDANASKIKKEISTEQKVRAELFKGRSHAEKENSHLLRESIETVDAMKMSAQVLQGLKSTITTHIATKLNPQDADGTTFQGGNDEMNRGSVGNNSNENGSPLLRIKTIHDVRKGQTAIVQMFKQLSMTMEEEAGRLRTATSKKNAIEADSSQKLVDEYEQRLAAAREDNKNSQDVLDRETQRQIALKANKEKESKRLSDLDKELAELTNLLASKKKAYSDKEVEKEKIVAASKEEESCQKKKLGDLDADLSNLISQHTNTTKQIKDAESHIQERESYKSSVEKERSERNKHFSEKVAVGSKLTATKTELDGHARSLLKQEKQKTKIEADKAANDEKEAKEFIPVKSESEAVHEEVKALEAMVEEIKANAEKENLEKEATELIEAKNKAKEELSAITDELTSKQSKLEERNNVVEEFKSSALLIQQLQDDSEIQRREIRDSANAYMEHCAKKEIRADLERKLHVMRTGAAILKKTAKKEQALELDA